MPTETFRYSHAPRRRRPPLVDVHRPAAPGPHPSVVVVHGGGFFGGWRGMRAVATLARELPRAGFVTVAFDYRVLLRGGRFREAVEDTVTATRWWRARARQLGADPDDVSLVGISAGAPVAMAAAHALGPLRRVAGVHGPYDLTDLPGPAPRLLGRLLFGENDPAARRARSPAHTFDLPVPLALLHGVRDGIVDVRHSLALAAMRRDQDLPVDVHLYDGIGHGFLRHPDLPVTRKAVRDLIGFLRG